MQVGKHLNDILKFDLYNESALDTATSYELDGGVRVRVSVAARLIILPVKTGSRAHPASYQVGTGSSFSGDKAAGG
jgi:hypothetical protein